MKCQKIVFIVFMLLLGSICAMTRGTEGLGAMKGPPHQWLKHRRRMFLSSKAWA